MLTVTTCPVFPPLSVLFKVGRTEEDFTMAPCLAVSSRVNGNNGKSIKKAAVVGQGEK